MANKINDVWNLPVEKMAFGVEEDHPVRLVVERFDRRQNVKYDMHYGFELGVLQSGKMRRHYTGGGHCVSPGDVWLCGMWEPHGWEVLAAPCVAYVFIIYPPLLAQTHIENVKWLTPFNLPPHQRPRVSIANRKYIMKTLDSLEFPVGRNEDLVRAWQHVKLFEILLILHGQGQIKNHASPEHPPVWEHINKIVEMVFENKKVMTTQEAARLSGVNRNEFARRFRRIMGLSFAEFVLRFRVRSAAQELIHTAKAIKTIALDWRFSDVSHFHKCFRRYYGCTPAFFRLQGQVDAAPLRSPSLQEDVP